MGVPKFYKWLSERYPLINQMASSDIKPEFDNLYLDMNGIIHNSTHSDLPSESGRMKSLSEEQQMVNVFNYIEKLFLIARPRKLLYMALDGVAPRAKMNQQRQRRFRAAKDMREAAEEARRRGEDVDPAAFDSNCITPGTEFMSRLSDHLRFFVRKKLATDAAWRGVRVIFSGADVPGEGEHKLMLYIRHQKMQPGYDPNQRHLLYGLDADLVMLSLVSHEVHFSLLREEVVFGQQGNLPRKVLKKHDQFQFLHISLLREYMDLEFRQAFFQQQQQQQLTNGNAASSSSSSAPSSSSSSSGAAGACLLPFEYNLERIIDDWVILAFFVGNDFLPHMPTLDIGEGGLDTLYALYKEELPGLGGYIFDPATRSIHWKRLEAIARRMGQLEESVFLERQQQAIDFARKQRRKDKREAPVLEVHEDELFEGEASPSPDPELAAAIAASLLEPEAAAAAEALRKQQEDAKPKIIDSQLSMLIRSKESAPLLGADGEELDYDSLTFKARYYREKFPEFFDVGTTLLRDSSGTSVEDGAARNVRKLVQNYTQGLLWVCKYYYEGCRSWKWFFAYRYAPLASDLVDLAELDLTLPLAYPFRPMEQLLGVLPPSSGAKFLPPVYRELMDPRSSPIADFYPLDFSLDMNGKRSPWEAIALIPFIDEARMFRALRNVQQSALTPAEQRRNRRYGEEFVYEHDDDCNEPVPSTLACFPSLAQAKCTEKVFHVPYLPLTPEEQKERAAYEAEIAEKAKEDPSILPVPELYAGRFVPDLAKGVKFPTAGYPSIALSVREAGGQVVAKLEKLAVNVFGMESKKESLMLRVTRPSYPSTIAIAKQFMSQRAFADWPYLKECLVVRITDATHIWSSSGGRQMSSTEAGVFKTEALMMQQKLLSTRAVDVGAIQVVFGVQLFEGMKRTPTGAIKRSFSEEITNVPFQLIFSSISNPDPRYAELPPPSIAEAFPIGATIVHIGPQHYGSIGTILGHDADGRSVSVRLSVGVPETSFGRQIAQSSGLQFYPSYLVSKSLNIHPLVLSKICSSVFVTQERTDIGLKIKFSKQSMQVPEYARRVEAWNESGTKGVGNKNNVEAGAKEGTNEGWSYSEKTVALLAAYKRRFPLLFEMMNEEPNTFKYDGARLIQASPAEASSDLTRSAPQKTPSDAIKEIDTWLKTVGINNLLLIPCSSQLMAERGIKAVEQESARLAALREKQAKQEVVLHKVPVFHLYRPDPAVPWSPTETDLPELGDRILSLRSDCGAPFALRGTVVCVHTSKHAEIVFDTEFLSGTHLHHKCAPLRGQTLHANAFLNLTKPKVLAPKQQVAQAAPATQQQLQQQQPQQQQAQAAARAPQQQQQQQAKNVNSAPTATAPSAAAAASSSAPAQPVQILRRPDAAPPAAAAASSQPPAQDASAMLKQMLQIGGSAPITAAAPSFSAAPASASASAASATAADDEEQDSDPMQRMLNKGKARKAKPVASAAGTGIVMGPPMAMAPPGQGPYPMPPYPMQPMPMQPMPMPMMPYGAPPQPFYPPSGPYGAPPMMPMQPMPMPPMPMLNPQQQQQQHQQPMPPQQQPPQPKQ